MTATTAGHRTGTITVVGNPGLDTLVLLEGEEPDLMADGHFTHNVDTVGGAAGYTARGAATLGHRVRLLGSLGADPAGRTVRDVLESDGVDCQWVFPDPVGTTRSVNLITRSGRRIFFFDGGAHMTCEPPPGFIEGALAGSDLVFSSLANWARQVLPAARGKGIPIAVDLQDVREPQDPYRLDFIAAADYLFASAAHLADPLGAAQEWLAMGPAKYVVFGMGPRGALLVGRDGAAEQVGPPLCPLPIVDTTGAGDGLATGFLDGLLFCDLDARAALVRGQLAARVTASQVGGDRLATDAQLAGLTGGSSG